MELLLGWCPQEETAAVDLFQLPRHLNSRTKYTTGAQPLKYSSDVVILILTGWLCTFRNPWLLKTVNRVLGGCDLWKHQGWQNNNPCEARRKSGWTWLNSQCWFKLLESDAGQFILGVLKHSTILGGEMFPSDNSIPCVHQSLRQVHMETLQSTSEFFHKDGFYWRRNNAHSKGLGKMTETNIKVWGSQVWPGRQTTPRSPRLCSICKVHVTFPIGIGYIVWETPQDKGLRKEESGINKSLSKSGVAWLQG